MWLFLCLCAVICAHPDSIHSQLSTHQHLILKQQTLLSQLSRAHKHLLNSTATPSTQTSFLELVDQTSLDSVFSRFIPKSVFPVNAIQAPRNITSLDMIALRPMGSLKDGKDYLVSSGHNLGVLVGYSDGTVEVLDVYGEVLYRYQTGHQSQVSFLVSTGINEGNLNLDLKFLTLSQDKIIRLHTITMYPVKSSLPINTDYGTQSSRVNMTITLESTATLFTNSTLIGTSKRPMDGNELFLDPETLPTAVILYVKSGMKYWIIGDSKGGISIHHYNGTFYRRENVEKGAIRAFDRFGPILAFAAGGSVGLFSLQTLQTTLLCDSVSAK